MVSHAGSTWPNDYHQFLLPGAALDSPPHSDIHYEMVQVVTVMQLVLGLNPEGVYGTVRDRLDSVESSVPGLGPWGSYNPESSAVSTGVGSIVARYRRLQQFTCAVHFEFNFGAGSAITGSPTVKVPFAPRAGSLSSGTYVAIRNGLTPRHGNCYVTPDRIVHFVWDADPTGLWSATGPTSGANGDQLVADLIYETATAI